MLERKVVDLERRLDIALNPAKYNNTPTVTKSAPKKEVSVQKVNKKYTVKGSQERYLSSNPISAKLFQKSLKMSGGGDVDDYITVLLTFKNNDMRPISAFKGEITFKNAFGDSLLSFNADITKYLAPSKGSSWYGGIVYNAADQSQRKLLDMKIHDITTTLRLKEIVYGDGNRKSVDDGDW